MGSYGSAPASEVEKILLRFRPIAPKPAAAAFLAGDTTTYSEHALVDGKISGGRFGRRRKCGASADAAGGHLVGRGAAAGRERRKKTMDPHPFPAVPVIDGQFKKRIAVTVEWVALERRTAEQSSLATLPLLPERPDCKLLDEAAPSTPKKRVSSPPTSPQAPGDTISDYRLMVPLQQLHEDCHLSSTASVIVVECAMAREPSVDAGMWLCFCDEMQARWGLHADASPAFITDASGRRVTWANAAYWEMVYPEARSGSDRQLYCSPTTDMPHLVSTRWAANMPLPPTTARAFSCWVTVRHKSESLTVPCDVWRLADSAMTWRLDAGVALRLRR